MNRIMSAALAAVLTTTSLPAMAQSTAPSAPAVATAPLVLPAGTQILLANNTEITSTEHRAGHVFALTVAQDVRVGEAVVIPRGTRAAAEITWRTGRGAFGKSGKLAFSMRYLDMNGTRIPILGSFQQEGEGATLATGGAILLAGVIGGALVTGSRARIPAGREFTVTLADATPFVMAGAGAQLDPAFRPRSVEEVTAAENQRWTRAAEETCRSSAPPAARRNERSTEAYVRRCVTQAQRRERRA